MSFLYNALKDFGLGNAAIIVFIISLFIDLTPGIKFNPIKWIIKQFGTAFNHSIDKKIESFNEDLKIKFENIEKDIDEIKKKQEEQSKQMKQQEKDIDIAELNRLKQEILDFSNRLQQKQKFVAEEYRTIMDCYSRYHGIIDKYEDLENGKIDPEYQYILNHYLDHKDDGDYMF